MASSPYAIIIEVVPDSTKPGITDFKINNNDAATKTKDVVLTISATDNTASQDLLKMRFKNEADASFTQWEDYKATKDFSLSDGDGLKTVTVEIKDQAGNSSAADESITLDKTSPQAGLAINNDDATADTKDVVLTISATDNTASQDLLKMRFKNEADASFTQWEDYKATKDFSLSDGDGLKTVTVEVKDQAGNTSLADDSITLDTITSDKTPPQADLEINNDDATTDSRDVTLNLSASDDISDQSALSIRYKDEVSDWSEWTSYPGSNQKAWTLSEGDGDKTVYIQVKDEAGNIADADDSITLETTVPDKAAVTSGTTTPETTAPDETTVTSDTTTPETTAPDKTAPQAGIAINNNDATTDSRDVTLNLSASDDISAQSALSIRYKDDGSDWSEWTSYPGSNQKSWTLPDGDGDKTVHIQVKDQAGNTSSADDSITLKTTVPDVISPQASVSINNKDATTDSRDVTLNLSASDDISDKSALSIRYKNDGSDWSEWKSYPDSNQKSWTLSEGDGDKTVYIQVKDQAGNKTDANDSISYKNPDNPPDSSGN